MRSMIENKTQKILITIIIVALLVGVVLFVRHSKNTPAGPGTTATSTLPTATTTTIGGVNFQTSGDYTIEQVPVTNSSNIPKPIPDLNRPVTFSSTVNLSADAQALATEKIKEFQSLLKKNPADISSWVNLGIYQKMTGDYDGAVLSWTYAHKLLPTDFISLGNLGNLYAYYIHDNAKAEMYYKQALVNCPTQAYLYIQLAEVYRDIFQDITKARAIVDQGFAKIPDDANLLSLKKSLSN